MSDEKSQLLLLPYQRKYKFSGYVSIEANGKVVKITNAQLRVLLLIENYILKHGYPPTQYEIMKLYGCASTNAVRDFLIQLERKGLISCGPTGRSRAIRSLRLEYALALPAGVLKTTGRMWSAEHGRVVETGVVATLVPVAWRRYPSTEVGMVR